MADTVTIACKLPHGLVLKLYDMIDLDENMPNGGSRTIKKARPLPGQVIIKGYLTKYRGSVIQPAAETSSFAYTSGVDKEFWERWVSDNADLPAVVNKLIFAAPRADTAENMAREFKGIKNGLEPTDPDKLPKGIQKAETKD